MLRQRQVPSSTDFQIDCRNRIAKKGNDMSESKTPVEKTCKIKTISESATSLPGQERNTVTIASITTSEVIGDGGKKSTKPIMKFVGAGQTADCEHGEF